jgi:glycosyltransferase involved in cell wall biosynthesis
MTRPGRGAGRWLVITNWRDSSHAEAGGAEVVCEQLAQRFAAAGHDVVILTAAVPGQPRKERRDGYTLVRRGGRFTVYPWALLWLALHRNVLEGVVDSQNGIPFFTPLVVRRNTPVVLLLHHVHQQQFSRYFPPLVAGIGRWLESTGSRVVYGERAVSAVSPSTRQEARRQLGLKGTIHVAPPGWDNGRSGLSGPRLRQVRPSIVCVGRLVPHKRTDLIIAAMPRVVAAFPLVELHIIGDGAEGPRLRRLVADLDVEANVTLHGNLDATMRDRILQAAWLTVNASEGEGWGLSVVEANALGVPALAFRRPGLRDSIRDGETGWLIADEDDLGTAICAVLTELGDAHFAAELSERARQWSALFTWKAMADKVMALLEAERGRLAQADDRRASTDLATVVHVPAGLLPEGWRPTFRLTDRWIMNARGFAILLPGADHETTSDALRRAGLPESVVSNPLVRAVVARPRDHISPLAELFEDLDAAGAGHQVGDGGDAAVSANGKAGPRFRPGAAQAG